MLSLKAMRRAEKRIAAAEGRWLASVSHQINLARTAFAYPQAGVDCEPSRAEDRGANRSRCPTDQGAGRFGDVQTDR